METAGTLEEARTQLQERRFDAVITDMRLPDGLGLNWAARPGDSSARNAAW